jgi:hypothetical protein
MKKITILMHYSNYEFLNRKHYLLVQELKNLYYVNESSKVEKLGSL